MEQNKDFLVIRTNWKQPWSRKIVRALSYTLGLFGVLIPLAGIGYTLVSILSGKGNPYDKNGMTVSDVVILNLFCILAVSFICGWIPMLFKYLFPITYEVKNDSGILKISRNGKNIFSASRNEITNVQFITNVTKTSAGTEITRGSQFGDTLQIDYCFLRSNGRKKAKQFEMNLAWLENSDRFSLKSFIASFLQNTEENEAQTNPLKSAGQPANDSAPQNQNSKAAPIEPEHDLFDARDLLPSFEDMDNEPTPEEILRVAAITDTMLHLTFKNPFPIEQDPVFKAVLQANIQSLMESLESGKLKVGDHEELKLAFQDKHPEKVAKALVELDYWNMRMIEHAVLAKGLGPKPAYNCLSAAYSNLDFAPTPLCVLIVNYAHLLLRFKMLKLANPAAISDVMMVLKQASTYLGFDEGRNYNP